MNGAPPLSPDLFDLGERLWLMHCAEGPVPRSTAEAVSRFLDRELHPWLVRWPDDFVRLTDDAHALAARAIGVEATDITLTTNTSTGLGTIAHGFPWTPGDAVLAPLGEFPSNTLCWKALAARGVAFREAALWPDHRAGDEGWASAPPGADADIEARLLDALTPSTRVLAASWVRFQDGLVLDLARLGAACRARDVTLVIDGIQGAGTLVPELSRVDAFACGGHKGLLAPQGQGFLFTTGALRERMVPMGSWLSVGEGDTFARSATDRGVAWRTDGRRLEAGGLALLMLTGLCESLRVLDAAGIPAIADHVTSLRRQLIEGLATLPVWTSEGARLGALDRAGRLGPLVCLHHGTRGQQGLDALARRGIASGIYTTVREGYLRVALHGFHTARDIDRLLALLATA